MRLKAALLSDPDAVKEDSGAKILPVYCKVVHLSSELVLATHLNADRSTGLLELEQHNEDRARQAEASPNRPFGIVYDIQSHRNDPAARSIWQSAV